MVSQIKNWISDHQLMIFIMSALGAAGAAVLLSVWLYVVTGAVKLDLSRPGYEDVRKDVTSSDDSSTKTYPNTGTLDGASIEEFENYFNKIKESVDFRTKCRSEIYEMTKNNDEKIRQRAILLMKLF